MGFYLSQLKSRENHSFWYGNSHQSTHSIILSLWGLSEMDSITLVFYFSDRERLFIVDRHSYIEMHLGFDDFVEFSEEISEYSRCWLANFNFGLGQRLLTCARAHLAAILMCYNAISFRFYVIHRGTRALKIAGLFERDILNELRIDDITPGRSRTRSMPTWERASKTPPSVS